MTTTTETSGTSAQGEGAPAAGNVSDETTPVAPGTASNVNNDNSASTPAATRSDDTRGAGFDVSKLLDKLDALPESIANAVKEAAPVAPVTAPTPDNSTGNAGESAASTGATGESGATTETVKATRHERFNSWWFGK